MVQLLEPGVKCLVGLVLPFGGGGITKKDSAAHGADGVNPADFAALEDAGPGGGSARRRLRRLGEGKLRAENGQLGRRDEEAVAEFIKPAAAAGQDAKRPAAVNLSLQVGVERGDLSAQIAAPGGGEDGGFESGWDHHRVTGWRSS